MFRVYEFRFSNFFIRPTLDPWFLIDHTAGTIRFAEEVLACILKWVSDTIALEVSESFLCAFASYDSHPSNCSTLGSFLAYKLKINGYVLKISLDNCL